MKKAVIATGGKQYLIQEGDVLMVEKLTTKDKTFGLTPLLVIDNETVNIGTPEVSGVKVAVEVIEPEVKADKVTSIRYKSKKRVKKVHGHRQVESKILIKKIALK